MDKAKLRENARILRTIYGELGALYKVKNDRLMKEYYKTRDIGEDDEETRIQHAEASVLGNLTKAFLALTEELAGDIDQDIRPDPPPG
jgi:hypothetical protein